MYSDTCRHVPPDLTTVLHSSAMSDSGRNGNRIIPTGLYVQVRYKHFDRFINSKKRGVWPPDPEQTQSIYRLSYPDWFSAVMIATAPKCPLCNRKFLRGDGGLLTARRCLINSGLELRFDDKGDRILPSWRQVNVQHFALCFCS
jgi:hypothetical protein